MITLSRLKYFGAVVRAGSVSQAAKELGMAQPALSNQIRDLEAELGVTLLERHSRGVLPTEAGRLLNLFAGEFDRLANRMYAELRAVGGVTGRPVELGLTPSLMRLVGVDLLVAAAERGGPELRLVEALSIALVQAVERREIEIAFAYDAEERAGLIREPVLRDELLFVTAPGGPEGPISFQEAIAHELSFAGDHGIVALVRRTAARLSLEPRIVSNIQSISAIHDRIVDGGASLLSYGTAAEGVQRGLYAVRRIVRPELTRTLFLVRRADNDPVQNDPQLAALLAGMVQGILRGSAPYATLLDTRYAV